MRFQKGNVPHNKKPNKFEWERQGSCIVVTKPNGLRNGYIYLYVGPKNSRQSHRYLHRMVCERRNGPLGGLFALHSCDNPKCINPEHLRPGTQRENIQDAKERGRLRPFRFAPQIGEAHWNSKLSKEDAGKIRESSDRNCNLARAYNVTPSMIYRIKKGISWKEVV